MVNKQNASETFFCQKWQSDAAPNNAFDGYSNALISQNRQKLRFCLITCYFMMAILLSSLKLNAQSNFRNYVVTGSLLFAGGCSDGTTEALKYRYPEFKKVFPNSNDQFWDPSISWENKYKDNNPVEGPKYFGSTTVFVGFTDSYHMSRMLRNSFVFGAIAFKIGEPKQKWYYYVGEFIGGGIIYKAGFSTTYEIMFHK